MLWAKFAMVSALRSDISIDAGRPCTAADTPLEHDVKNDKQQVHAGCGVKPTPGETHTARCVCWASAGLAVEAGKGAGQTTRDTRKRCTVRYRALDLPLFQHMASQRAAL